MYYTPAQLLKFGLLEDVRCTRCGQDGANFMHLVWDCTLIHRFWQHVVKVLFDMTLEKIVCTPELCLLGLLKKI